MLKLATIALLLGTLVTFNTYPPRPVYLHGLTPMILTPVDANARSLTPWPQNNCAGGRCYAVLQFDAIPDQALVDELTAVGIQLYDFIPDFAYLASLEGPETEVALPDGVVAVGALSPQNKRSPAPMGWASPVEGDVFRFIVLPFRGFSVQSLNQQLQLLGYNTTGLDDQGVYVDMSVEEVPALLEQPGVMYVEGVNLPSWPEGIVDRSLSRNNQLNRGPGWGYDGRNVTIGLADDGGLLHLDFKGRVIDRTTGNLGNHGEMTSGLAIGAGNIDPLGLGMAPGARLVLFDIASYEHITQAPLWYSQYRMVITSTSYGEGCGGFYSLTAQQLDQQVWDHPMLLHFFSAGNSGAEACPNIYGGLETNMGFHYGNITGGRKTSKNAITVGNVSSDDVLRSTSSRGPTSDGRLKPDICAQGQGSLTTGENNTYRQSSGTSASAPSLAGGAACLYDYYRETYNDQDPPAALIKACLLNSAEDLGVPGPDFSYGWGRANLARALAILQQGNYQQGNVAAGSTNTHTVMVAAGVKEVKIMLYWNDRAGSPLAAKSLVNDLDARVVGPNGQLYTPWSPSSVAHVDSLGAPAHPRADRLNNAEQVVIVNPAPGTYSIQINGYQVPQGPQPYVLVFSYVYDNLEITYPIADDALEADEVATIRWEAYGNTTPFTLEYSTNAGASWQTIASNIPGSQRYYEWTTPLQTSAQAMLRLRRGSQVVASSGTFSICASPAFDVQYHATNQCRVYWPPVAGAIGYEVFTLGDEYMQVVGTTTAAEWLMPVAISETYWISVRALLPGGKKGPRAIARKYIHQGCAHSLTLVLNFDQYPGESSWRIRAEDGTVLASGGPYIGQGPNSQLILNVCLPAGCFDFVMLDTYGDGMCCLNGNGSYALIGANGVVHAYGSTFAGSATTSFCTAALQPLQLSAVQSGPALCAGGQNGWASIVATGGTGNYTYTWSNGLVGNYASGLGAGTYSITISDGQSSIFTSVAISEPAPLSYQVQTLPATCQNGGITLTPVGGNGPYQIYWQNGLSGTSIQGLSAGDYAFTLSDANGCTMPSVVQLPQGTPLQLASVGLSPSCFGAADGFVSVQATGGNAPYSYVWNNGATAASVANLAAGTYSVTVSDARGCQAQLSRVLSSPALLTVAMQSTPALPNGGGSAQAIASGGTPPYAYLWNTGATTDQLMGIPAGDYRVTVTDDLGCTTSASVYISPSGIASYCNSRGTSTSYEWIQRIKVNNNEVLSGNNGGYGNYQEITFPLTRGTTALIELSPGYTSQPYNEYWRVYIDFNRDGDFIDPGETIVSAGPTNQLVLRSFVTPANASIGLTRMRVSMQYGSFPGSCGILSYGEVEDYTISILPQNLEDDSSSGSLQTGENETPDSGLSSSHWQVWPNPVGDNELNIKGQWLMPESKVLFELVDAQGRLLRTWEAYQQDGLYEERLPVSQLPAGLYQVRVRNEHQLQILRFVKH